MVFFYKMEACGENCDFCNRMLSNWACGTWIQDCRANRVYISGTSIAIGIYMEYIRRNFPQSRTNKLKRNYIQLLDLAKWHREIQYWLTWM